jgi:hypothetical protein
VIQLEILDLRRTGGTVATCPKCESPLKPGASECLSCGVLIPKILSQIEDPFQADFRKELGADFTDRWQSVVADYENEAAHWNFILHCQQFRALEFAAYRYRRLVDVVRDDIAVAMLKRVEALALMELDEESLNRKIILSPELVTWSRSLIAVVCFVGGMALFLGFGGVAPLKLTATIGAIILASVFLLRVIFHYYYLLRLPEEQEIYDFVHLATGGKASERF